MILIIVLLLLSLPYCKSLLYICIYIVFRAAAKGLLEMVQILLTAGVDIEAKTKFGSMIYDKCFV